ncbi:MAG TPA: hypothetical protein VMV18_05435, partial [bacterium]|nr:hypothetical protein [bacterium]
FFAGTLKTPGLRTKLPPPPPGMLYAARDGGCARCGKIGYRGRLGIYELLVVDPEVKPLIVARSESGVIARKAQSRGMETLRDDGATKVLEGTTTVAEVLRSTQLSMITSDGTVA